MKSSAPTKAARRAPPPHARPLASSFGERVAADGDCLFHAAFFALRDAGVLRMALLRLHAGAGAEGGPGWDAASGRAPDAFVEAARAALSDVLRRTVWGARLLGRAAEAAPAAGDAFDSWQRAPLEALRTSAGDLGRTQAAVDSYAAALRQRGAFCTQVEVEALSRVLRADIVVATQPAQAPRTDALNLTLCRAHYGWRCTPRPAALRDADATERFWHALMVALSGAGLMERALARMDAPLFAACSPETFVRVARRRSARALLTRDGMRHLAAAAALAAARGGAVPGAILDWQLPALSALHAALPGSAARKEACAAYRAAATRPGCAPTHVEVAAFEIASGLRVIFGSPDVAAAGQDGVVVLPPGTVGQAA